MKMEINCKLLDCTLRDGGYYTSWDFDTALIDTYTHCMGLLPVDYIEVGYRNNPSGDYMGKLGYTPLSVLRRIREQYTKKIVIMLNEKSTRPSDLERLLVPIRKEVDMVRIAVDPANFERAVDLARAVKDLGFEVGFNVMYMSKWKEQSGFMGKLHLTDGIADLFCMVDSFGGITPGEVEEICHEVKANTSCPIGFHGHNNLQLGLPNTLTAIRCGVDFVDATILGMGRGAGNLNMELLLTVLNKSGLDVDFNVLGEAVSAFQPLLDKYKWGTNLPYMLSGAHSIPQKEVMEWVTNRAYSFNSVVRALDNKRNKREDNARYPIFAGHNAKCVLVVGGGNSVVEHKDAILEYLGKHPQTAIVFVTTRHVAGFASVENPKYFILVGNEAKRMKTNIKAEEFTGACILPPYPRKMGTEIPGYAEHSTYELKQITFTCDYPDSCTTVALQTAIDLGAEEIALVGYDGYKGGILSEKETDLTNENRTIFHAFGQMMDGKRFYSLTPSLYRSLKVNSIYQFI